MAAQEHAHAQNPEAGAVGAGSRQPRGFQAKAGRAGPEAELRRAEGGPARMGESIPLAAPVPVEQAVLETFFSHLGIFSYDKAKDNVEKEREANKGAGGSWLALLAALAHLAVAEKAYHSLTYLGQKLGGQSFFSRKDSIRTIYTSLHNELKKVVVTGRGAAGGTVPHLEELLSHLSEQLCFFVQARVEIADFYEKMYTLSTQKSINSEELVSLLESILKKYSSRFHHPILSPLESSFQLEVDVLAHLLKSQAQISEWKFLLSLVNLHSAHTKLQTWGQIFEKQRETKKHLFGGQSQKAVQPPHLFLWLMKLKNMLLAKFSFYFHEALSRQTTASEMKALTAKANPDLFGKISSFIRKYDAANVSLIFDNRGSESFQGHGYHHPHSYREAPKGVDQYPAVVSLPSDRPVMHWPNVIMIMTDRTSDLNTLEKIVHFYDDKVQSTYFLTRPEPHFTLVVIFESKKSEKDSHFLSFLNELSHALKNPKVFASLKPGSKG
uniref:KICSTOR subunit 2 n=2 Tax=Monodelphis domestica TaxID=13616 RepID=A0A5F8G1Y6_MONDO